MLDGLVTRLVLAGRREGTLARLRLGLLDVETTLVRVVDGVRRRDAGTRTRLLVAGRSLSVLGLRAATRTVERLIECARVACGVLERRARDEGLGRLLVGRTRRCVLVTHRVLLSCRCGGR